MPQFTAGELPTDEVPKDWSTKSKDSKLEWLDKQGVPANRTVSLGTTYRRGAKLTHYFNILYNVLRRVRTKLDKDGSDKTKKLFLDVIKSFNAGVYKLDQAIYNDCLYLLEHGKYGEEPPVLDPIPPHEIPLDELLDGHEDSPADDSWWGLVMDIINILVQKFPGLQKARPQLGGAKYSELLIAFTKALGTFLKEYHKEKGTFLPLTEGVSVDDDNDLPELKEPPHITPPGYEHSGGGGGWSPPELSKPPVLPSPDEPHSIGA